MYQFIDVQFSSWCLMSKRQNKTLANCNNMKTVYVLKSKQSNKDNTNL